MLVRVGYHREENIASFDEAAQVGTLIKLHCDCTHLCPET